jgi:lysocardiolipin and lysophospholipid acyltransferase
MLKEGIKKIPVLGWTIDKLDFLWMKRNWEADRVGIQHRLHRLATDEEPLWVIIFPEGMTVNTRSAEESRVFAKTDNRPVLDLTLLPRYKGLTALLEMMKGQNPEVVDITMAFDSYSGEIPTWDMCYERNHDHKVPNLKKLMAGMSGDAHLDVRLFDASTLLAHPNGVKGWLDERWARKDNLLRDFIRNDSFPRDEYMYEVKTLQGSFSRASAIVLSDAVVIYAFIRSVVAAWRSVAGVRRTKS